MLNSRVNSMVECWRKSLIYAMHRRSLKGSGEQRTVTQDLAAAVTLLF